MCGLAGWFGLNLSDRNKQEYLLRLLMRKAQVRGTDSFGIAFAQGTATKIHRGLGPVSKWLTKSGKRVRRVAMSSTVLGHTRAASRGDVSLVNSHAFRTGGWIGSHNGCIQNSDDLLLSANYAPRGETDSESALAFLVSENLTADAFSALHGWYAWTIMRDDASELVIAVDGRTPFALARIGDAVIWHSLAEALDASLNAVGIKAEIEEIKNQILHIPSGRVEKLPMSSPVARPLQQPYEPVFLSMMEPDDDDDNELPLFGGSNAH
jgi:glucosamine 6-phosphate synthetase-like amidotransferase/phosphosugar isomerase protein